MKSASLRRKYILSSFIKSFLKCYGITLLIYMIIMLISILTGAFSVAKFDGGLSEKDLFDKILFLMCEGKVTFWSVLFNRMFHYLLVIIISFLTSQNKLLLIINVILISIVGYFIGVDIGIIFSILSMRGIIFTVVIYIPLICFSILTLLMLNCVFNKKVQELTKYGLVCNRKEVVTVILIMILISIILQCALFPIFNNVFIILE